MAFLHVCHLPNFKKHCSNRCFIPVIALLLLVAVLAVTSTYYFTFPNRDIPFSWPSFSQGRACDIFRGEWVPDPDAPYYTNDTCSVIHEHYDCMKYGKPDLGFVQWRWRPDSCDLPRVDPARFLDVMRGKTMAFVGDSLARNHMHSLICLLTREEEETRYKREKNHDDAPKWPPNGRRKIRKHGMEIGKATASPSFLSRDVANRKNPPSLC